MGMEGAWGTRKPLERRHNPQPGITGAGGKTSAAVNTMCRCRVGEWRSPKVLLGRRMRQHHPWVGSACGYLSTQSRGGRGWWQRDCAPHVYACTSPAWTSPACTRCALYALEWSVLFLLFTTFLVAHFLRRGKMHQRSQGTQGCLREPPAPHYQKKGILSILRENNTVLHNCRRLSV